LWERVRARGDHKSAQRAKSPTTGWQPVTVFLPPIMDISTVDPLPSLQMLGIAGRSLGARKDLHSMWLKVILGVILVLLGAVWIGQGFGVILGSFMTGQMIWAIIGLFLVVIGLRLLWTALRRTTPSPSKP
jgi:hypothetical protein